MRTVERKNEVKKWKSKKWSLKAIGTEFRTNHNEIMSKKINGWQYSVAIRWINRKESDTLRYFYFHYPSLLPPVISSRCSFPKTPRYGWDLHISPIFFFPSCSTAIFSRFYNNLDSCFLPFLLSSTSLAANLFSTHPATLENFVGSETCLSFPSRQSEQSVGKPVIYFEKKYYERRFCYSNMNYPPLPRTHKTSFSNKRIDSH